MLFELAAVFGRGIKPERGYEVAGVLVGGLVIRAVTRALVKQTPHIGFAVKTTVAGATRPMASYQDASDLAA